MAVDMFLKIDGIKGESQDAKHKDEVQVMGFAFGATQAASHSLGGGGGVGKVNFQDIHFTKVPDKASAELLTHCANGKHIKEALLTVRKAGGQALEYLKIKLSDILVSSYQVTGDPGNQTPLNESISFNFSKIELAYTPQKADGSGDVAVLSSWNIKTNTAT